MSQFSLFENMIDSKKARKREYYQKNKEKISAYQKKRYHKNKKLKGKNNLGVKTKELWKNPEYRQHMSEAHKGQTAWNKGNHKLLNTGRTHFKKGQPSSRKGILHTAETKAKVSASRKNKCKGKEHWNWKGGKSQEKKLKLITKHETWREVVAKHSSTKIQKIKKPHRRLSNEQKEKLLSFVKGRNISQATREKMSRVKKGIRPVGYEKIKDMPCWNKGLTIATDERVRKAIEKLHAAPKPPPWNKGEKINKLKYPNMGHTKKHSKETIAKMSVARKGKSAPWNKGEKSPMWKGGVTPELKKIRGSIEFKMWREAVFTRDNWICQKYKIRGGKLHPHHILNFAEHPKLRFDVNNGITLSEKAHRQFHTKYGKSNNTVEQIQEFVNS